MNLSHHAIKFYIKNYTLYKNMYNLGGTTPIVASSSFLKKHGTKSRSHLSLMFASLDLKSI